MSVIYIIQLATFILSCIPIISLSYPDNRHPYCIIFLVILNNTSASSTYSGAIFQFPPISGCGPCNTQVSIIIIPPGGSDSDSIRLSFSSDQPPSIEDIEKIIEENRERIEQENRTRGDIYSQINAPDTGGDWVVKPFYMANRT